MTKTSLKIILPLLALALLLPFSAKAFTVKTGSTISVGQNETIDGNLYAAGSNLLIDGVIKGDVICAGQSIIINGKVEGDVICAGQSLNVMGEVGGSVRVAGSSINLNNKVGRNVMAFAGSVVLGSNSEIGQDVLVGAGNVSANGKIGGSLHGGVGMADINGQIAKDVALTLDSNKAKKALLTVTENAKIGGNLDYTAASEAKISKPESILGKITRQLPLRKQVNAGAAVLGLTVFWLWTRIIAIFGALVIGLILVTVFKNKILALADSMVASPALTFGWGAITLFITPFVLVFLLITVIGIPLAILLSLLWVAMMILGKVLAAILIGLMLMGRYRHRKSNGRGEKYLILSMILGVVVAYAFYSIPLIGGLFGLVFMIWGMGALWLYCKKECCAK